MKTIKPMMNKSILTGCVGIIALMLTVWGCREDLPGVGSIEDLTPPEASFGYAQLTPDNYLEVTFTNASISSTDYLWEFGDGVTSTDAEPVHVYASEGTYTVTLTSSDKLDVTSVSTLEITLTEPSAFIPPILEGSFEDGQLEGGTGDGRDSWRNEDLGGVIQITSDPVVDGVQAAKLTGDPGDKRIGYQLLTVTENTVYDLSFNYTMKDDQTNGLLTVAVLDGPVLSHDEALNSMLGKAEVSNQTSPDVYVRETFSFFSGSNTEVAIYFFNDGTVETRLDDFSIAIGEGSIPPSAAFSYETDANDFLTINFTNNSINAATYLWGFGDGNTDTDESPSHTYTAEGTYNVTLTATSDVGESNVSTMDVVVKEPSAIFINNPSFDDEPVRDDNRIVWRNETLEADADAVFGNSSYVLQTSSTARTGSFAGKLPTLENSSDPRRWLYQEITVDPNTDYTIKGWVRNKDSDVGSTVTFEIYDAPFSTATTIGDANFIIASEDFDASTGHDTSDWTEASITFNSGSSTVIVLFITNDYTLNGDPDTEESESFFDDFSIEEI